MGQSSSGQRPEAISYLDSDDERGFKPSRSHSPDIAFSSQVPASTDRHRPFTLSDVQQFKYEASSSPTVPRPTESSPVQVPKVEAMNSPSVASSHNSLSAQSTRFKSPISRKKKKKKRNKRRSSSTRRLEDDNQPSLPRSSIDLDGPTDRNQKAELADELNDDDDGIPQVHSEFDMNEAPTSGDMLSEKKKRRQQKRERKAQKKAAKQMRLRTEGEDNTSLSHKYEPLEIYETTLPGTLDSPKPNSDSDSRADVTIATLPDDLADAVVKSSKKRKLHDSGDVKKTKKRKRHHGSRKFSVHSASGDSGDTGNYAGEDVSTTEVITGSQSHEPTHAKNQSSPPSGNNDSNFSNLAEKLYTGRKSTTSLEVEQRKGSDANNDVQNLLPNHTRMEHGSRDSSFSLASISNGVDPNVDSEASLNIPPVDEMDVDVDGSTGKAPDEDSPASESGHDTSSSDEKHQGNQMVVDEINEIDEEPGAYHDNDTDENCNDDVPNDDSNSEAPSSAKATQLDPNGAGMRIPDSHSDDNATNNNELTNGVSEDQVEVPSSVPYQPNYSSEAGSDTQEHSKPSTGRRRVAKTPYYDRKAKLITDAFRELPSPSAAAASRRINSREAGKKDDNTISGPSNASAGKKKRKISAMLRGNDEDSSDYEPSTSSKPRSARQSFQKAEGGSGKKKTGPFTDAELGDISRAVERWREDHEMTQFQINKLIQSPPKQARTKGMWDWIAAACPDRPRQKVINQCRRKFHNFVARGTWTDEQHDELTQLVAMHGEKHAKIGKIINRHPEDVRDRIRNYVRCGDNRRTNAWDDAEESKLKIIVREAIGLLEALREKDRKARKDKSKQLIQNEDPIEDQIDWAVVSERMGTRGRLQCITKWKRIKAQSRAIGAEGLAHVIHEARESAVAMSHIDRYRIVRAIRSSGANADSRIPWARIRDELLGEEGGTRAMIMVVWYRLKLSVLDWKIMSTHEVAHQLIKEYREKQALKFPPDTDIDLDAESQEIERRFYMLIKTRKKHKTPDLVESDDENASSSDDNDVEDGNGNKNNVTQERLEDEDDVMEDAPLVERSSSVDLGLATEVVGNLGKDDELEIEDSEPDVKSRQSSKVQDRRAELDSDSSVDAPSISEFKPQSARRSSKGYSSSGKAASTPKVTPGRFKKAGKKASTPSQDGKPFPNLSSSRKSTTSRKRQRQRYDEIEEVSSDTNASDVESIPAH